MASLAFAPTVGATRIYTRSWKQQPTNVFSYSQNDSQNHVVLYGLPKVVEKNAVQAATMGGAMIGVGTASVIGLAALVVGLFLGRLSGGKSGAQRLSNADEIDSSDIGSGAFLVVDDEQLQEEGVTPVWLNYAFARMWALFQKNTKRLVTDVMQPVLDETEKPEFVTAVRVASFKPGRTSPYLRSLKRLPSRALAEVQYSLQSLYKSNSVVDFEVDVNIKNKINFTLPVTLRNMDLDAMVWSAFSLAPYEPYCTSVQYALLKPPLVSFDMTIAGIIPITAVPVLRSFFFRVVTKEIPKEFMFPKTVTLDFTPELITSERKSNVVGIQNMESMTQEQLIELYPEQWALFDALDLDGGGTLSPVEIFSGLKDWGYTASDATESFAKLDLDQDGKVDFVEFCKLWPALATSFVPNKYKGVLAVFLRSGENMPKPLIGPDDPIVKLRLGEQRLASKRDSRTSRDGKPGYPVWNEPFELNCASPRDETLEIVVSDGSRWAWRGLRAGKEIGKATIELDSLVQHPNQKVKVELEPQGSLQLDLSYADFVDRQSISSN